MYPGSSITVEQDLGIQNAVHVYIISYLSEGLKIYATMSVPGTPKPTAGYPVVIMAHGSVDPAKYDALSQLKYIEQHFAQQGYLILKPDYRGHGKSEGDPVPVDALKVSPYAAIYAIDVMNLIASVENVPDADGQGVVVWGHSLGSSVALWVMEVSQDPTLKAAVLVSGPPPTPEEFQRLRPQQAAYYPDELKQFATLRDASNIEEIRVPSQMHYGTNDERVPIEFHNSLYNALLAAGKTVEEKIYPGADHAYKKPADRALLEENSITFFQKYLGK